MRNRHAFTMIELLIVVIIIGVMAAIAMPRFADSRRKAYITAMKSDLRNVVSAAESHFADDGTYAQWTGPSATNAITLVYTGESDGWEATATHAAVPGVVCRLARRRTVDTKSEPICE